MRTESVSCKKFLAFRNSTKFPKTRYLSIYWHIFMLKASTNILFRIGCRVMNSTAGRWKQWSVQWIFHVDVMVFGFLIKFKTSQTLSVHLHALRVHWILRTRLRDILENPKMARLRVPKYFPINSLNWNLCDKWVYRIACAVIITYQN